MNFGWADRLAHSCPLRSRGLVGLPRAIVVCVFGPHRRLWLLLKALKTKTLREALSLAQAADRFLTQPSSDLPLARVRGSQPASTDAYRSRNKERGQVARVERALAPKRARTARMVGRDTPMTFGRHTPRVLHLRTGASKFP